MICVAAVDEQEAARYGLQRWLSGADESIVVTGSAANVAALLAGPGRDADVVLLDAGHAAHATLPADITALAGAGHAVVVTTGTVCSRLARVAFGNGASGLLSRSASAASAARTIRAAAHGDVLIPLPLARELAAAPTEVRLSPREATAARLYAAGMPLASVARRMRLSPQTVKQYIDRARGKYRSAGRPCPTKVHLYQRLIEDGLVEG
jgi:DNA-binding NarL/FixJ family response regulator